MSDAHIAPEMVGDNETIAHIVLSPSMVVDSRLSPTAFRLRMLGSGPETYVSVWRHDFIVPSRENTGSINLPEENVIYGYAAVKAGVCRSISFGGITTDIKAYPNKRNPFHAGICFSKFSERIKGACQEPGFIAVTKALANRCTLVAI